MVRADAAASSKPLYYSNFLFGYIKGKERKVWSLSHNLPTFNSKHDKKPLILTLL